MQILKIIEALQSYSEDVIAYKLDSKFAHAVSEAVDLIIAQGELLADVQNERRWIPVTEQLPERFGVFIVAIKEPGRIRCGKDCADFDPFTKKWLPSMAWDKGWTVTHWMALPAPPEEEEE